MKNLKFLSTVFLLLAVAGQANVVFGVGVTPALTLTDIGSTPPATSTYSQPLSVSDSDPSVDKNAYPNGLGEEITLSGGDPTRELTDVYVKSSGSNTGAVTTDWTLNLYDETNGKQYTLTADNVTAGYKDYLDFHLSDTNDVQLRGGDTYAFTITTSADFNLAGDITAGLSSPAGGIASDEVVTGNGDFASLTADGPDAGGALTFYLGTVAVPEPANWVLIPVIGTMALFGFRRLRNAKGA